MPFSSRKINEVLNSSLQSKKIIQLPCLKNVKSILAMIYFSQECVWVLKDEFLYIERRNIFYKKSSNDSNGNVPKTAMTAWLKNVQVISVPLNAEHKFHNISLQTTATILYFCFLNSNYHRGNNFRNSL